MRNNKLSYNKLGGDPVECMKEAMNPEDFNAVMEYAKNSGLMRFPDVVKVETDSEDGGLWARSTRMAKLLMQYTDILHLPWENPRTPFLVGLFHAAGAAEGLKYDDALGVWMFEGAPKNSADIIGGIIPLTTEEDNCLRYCAEESRATLMKVAEVSRNVLWVHHACLISIADLDAAEYRKNSLFHRKKQKNSTQE